MDRKDFLASIGVSTVAFALINCAGCNKSSDAPLDVLCQPWRYFFRKRNCVTNGPASRALTTYHTQLRGTSLRIYS